MTDSRPKNRPIIWLLIVAIVVVMALVLWPRLQATQASLNSVRPDKTRRAIAARSTPIPLTDETPAEPIPVDEEDLTPVTLWVYPKAEGSWKYPGSTGYPIDPSDYWPMADEAPWPDIESSDTLQVLAEKLRSNGSQLGETAMLFLQQAEKDGLLDLADDPEFDNPWTGLVAMQAEFVESFRQTGFWPKPGTVDYTRGLTIAQHIVDTWPDDPAAEYARLHLLQLSNHPGSTRHNTDETVDWIVDIIENTQDSIVLDVAIGEFTVIQDATFDDPTMAAIESVFDQTEINTQRGIIRAMLNHHTHTENWAQVDVWTHQLMEHEKQVQWDKDNKPPVDTPSVLSDLAGYRAVRQGHTPSHWREEVSTVVHMCHDDHPAPHSISGEAEWADGWQWNAWWKIPEFGLDTSKPPDAPDFIDCVQLTDWQHEPPQATLLTLKVMR